MLKLVILKADDPINSAKIIISLATIMIALYMEIYPSQQLYNASEAVQSEWLLVIFCWTSIKNYFGIEINANIIILSIFSYHIKLLVWMV